MVSATITITDNTAKAQNLMTLLGGTTPIAGYTVVFGTGDGGLLGAFSTYGGQAYISVQASYKNGGTIVYRGGEKVKNDGTCQAKEMAAGDTEVYAFSPPIIHLGEIYFTASANGAVINVETHLG